MSTQDSGQYISSVRQNGLRLNANEPLVVASTATFSGTVNFTGSTNLTGAQTITDTSANAFAVGQNGITNPALNVNTNTASSATGLNITSAAAAAGLALATTSSGTNENLTIDAKGSGTVTINGTATGIVVLPAGTTIGGSVPLTSTITSSNANALVVGPNGATNPTFNVDASTASAATGLNIKGAAAAGGLALSVLSSGSNENLTLDAKGSGTISIGTISTGTVQISKTSIGSATSNALAVARTQGGTILFNIDASTGSASSGISIKANATGSVVAITTTDTGSNTPLSIAAKGTGTITFNPAVVATAGGATNDGIQFGSINVGLYTGTGAPTFSAMNGSIYVNSAATTTTTRIYVNNSGAGTAGTTWTNLTTAA